MTAKKLFTVFSQKVSYSAGHPAAFVIAVAIVLIWAVTGPIFSFNETWQLVINTGTTIITFLMVFLIQSTQNRDTAAMQIKLDELIRATQGTHNVLLDLEELDENDLEHIRKQYEQIAADGRKKIEAGQTDTDKPDIDIASICKREEES